MPQTQGQKQIQTERQLLRLSPQQLQLVKLIEMPVNELEEHIKNEVIDNVALEEGRGNREIEGSDEDEPLDNEQVASGADSDSIFDDYASPDDVPSYLYNQRETERSEMPIGDTRSFIDDLTAQIAEHDLNEHQIQLIEYLIGSLNNNGFIDRSLSDLADDLIIYQGIETSEEELEQMIKILHQFDPAGIGARNIQECLLIQLERENLKDSLEYKIIENYYDEFVTQRTEKLSRELSITADRIHEAFSNLSRLNPYPGISLCESSIDRVQTIIPDFIVETTPDGNISITLNDGDIPELHVSKEYADQLKNYMSNSKNMSRSEKEAFEYTRQKVESARSFIASIQQRHNTLYQTMKAIAHYQKDFILTQDETMLRTMRLADIAEQVGLDLSTISRVRNSKYVLIDGSLYSLDIFFRRSRINAEGEEMEHSLITDTIRQLIDSEDKANPLSDQQLEKLLREKGINISRRTIAKYRGQMGIPSTMQRKDV